MMALGSVCSRQWINAIFWELKGWLLLAAQSFLAPNEGFASWTAIHGGVMLSWFDWDSKANVNFIQIPQKCSSWNTGPHLQGFACAEITIRGIRQLVLFSKVYVENESYAVIYCNQLHIVAPLITGRCLAFRFLSVTSALCHNSLKLKGIYSVHCHSILNMYIYKTYVIFDSMELAKSCPLSFNQIFNQ